MTKNPRLRCRRYKNGRRCIHFNEHGGPHHYEPVTTGISDDPVTHPSHYNSGAIEVWDAIIDWELSFCAGNVVKYLARAGRKGAGWRI